MAKRKSELWALMILFTFVVALLWSDGVDAGQAPTSCSATPITFTAITTADFSMIEGVVGTGTIDMGTDANIAYGAGYSGAGLGVAGSFIVKGKKRCKISLACDSTAVIADASGNLVTITNIEIRKRRTRPFGSGKACKGTSVKVLTNKNISGRANRNTYFLAGSIDGTSGIPLDTFFSSANGGGNPITVIVTYDNP